MRERRQAVVEQARGPGRRERGGDVDDVNVGEFLRELGEREIGAAEAVAMAVKATLGQAQRLHRRLGQIVDQDRRRTARAKVCEQPSRLGDIGRERLVRTARCDAARAIARRRSG